MEDDGLTPPVESIAAVWRAFPRNGLMVMIRPRAGDFVYSENEIREMEANIASAAAGGADGVVFGVITENGLIDEKCLLRLIQKSQSKGVSTTFHRAFDVLEDRFEGLEMLIDYGVDRILTSGVAWGCSRGALEGKETLKALVEAAYGRIEIVIGGSVSPGNAKEIVSSSGQFSGPVSLHAPSGRPREWSDREIQGLGPYRSCESLGEEFDIEGSTGFQPVILVSMCRQDACATVHHSRLAHLR